MIGRNLGRGILMMEFVVSALAAVEQPQIMIITIIMGSGKDWGEHKNEENMMY
jgi:hypothetical protein